MYKKEKIKVAVLIPCYNEALTIEKVIKRVKKELDKADIYVYDNNSTDETGKIAKKNGAIVKRVLEQGKGNVFKEMFQDIKADYYITIDGDDSCDISIIKEMLGLATEGYDMIIGDRLSANYFKDNNSNVRNIGNRCVRKIVSKLLHYQINDVLSGYRVLNKKLVEDLNIESSGFEIETEITIKAIMRNYNIKQIPIRYKNRVPRSVSTLKIFKDGWKIFTSIFKFYNKEKKLNQVR